jgi:hypothetical protein
VRDRKRDRPGERRIALARESKLVRLGLLASIASWGASVGFGPKAGFWPRGQRTPQATPISFRGKRIFSDSLPHGARGGSLPSRNRRGARPDIYDYGLRNPWRFAFSRDGGMAIADVGEHHEEEIDFAPPGRTGAHNYGWRVFEGFHKTGTPRAHSKSERAASRGKAPGAISPAFAYKHPAICEEFHAPRPPRCGGCSITGGVFVRDPMLRGYGGRYVYGDYCTGHVYSLVLGGGPARFGAPALARTVPLISSFGEDAAGHVYVSSQSGAVYRLAPPALLRG